MLPHQNASVLAAAGLFLLSCWQDIQDICEVPGGRTGVHTRGQRHEQA